jgi:hypothetical protein
MGDRAAHSKFGASGSARFIACPGSVGLTERLDAAKQGAAPAAPTTSVFAAEGTAAHLILEKALMGPIWGALSNPRNHLGKSVVLDGHSINLDQEMVDAVELVVAKADELRAGFPIRREWVEQRVVLDRLWTAEMRKPPAELFGTCDFALLGRDQLTGGPPTDLVVLDFKYGKGVPVEVRDNAQLLYYALGALLDLVPSAAGKPFPPGHLPARITTIIAQPRAAHPEGPIRAARYTSLDVMVWGYDVLRPAVERALQPDASLVSGAHCRWCPALAVCPAMRQTALDAARNEFGSAPSDLVDLTGNELGEMLTRLALLEEYIEAIRDEARNRMTSGRTVQGWRLVQRKGRTTWAKPAMEVLEAAQRRLRLSKTRAVTAMGFASTYTLDTPSVVSKRLSPEDYRALVDAGLIQEGPPSNVLVQDFGSGSAVRRGLRQDFDAIPEQPF